MRAGRARRGAGLAHPRRHRRRRATRQHAKQFHAWATTFIDAAKTKDGVPDANITYLAEKPDVDAARIRDRSTREAVTKAVADIAAKARPGDQVVIC